MPEIANRVKQALLAMQRYSWEQGVAAQSLLEAGDVETAALLAHGAVVRQNADGQLGVMNDAYSVTDPGANGEPVLATARLTGDPMYAAAADAMLKWLLERAPRSEKGVLYHVVDKPQVWIDSVYMAPPFLAAAGRPEEAVRQVDGYRELLWHPQDRLFAHIWDDRERAWIRAAHWGVGNGWAIAGMVRVLAALPESMREDRERIAGYVREAVDGCLAHQREDGLFHDVLDDPATFVETNAAQMIAYGIYHGVRLGCLDESYLVRADRMREAARAKVDGRGLVQGVCAAPTFDRPGTAPEGQAFFLLMESAAARMGRRKIE